MSKIDLSKPDEEILLAIARFYADPENYEPWEKDMGNQGNMSIMPPRVPKDRGQTAREGLEVIARRKANG